MRTCWDTSLGGRSTNVDSSADFPYKASARHQTYGSVRLQAEPSQFGEFCLPAQQARWILRGDPPHLLQIR